MNHPIIIDGAMGTELQNRGIDIPLPLWSADANLKYPDVVTSIHEDYIISGADIITTNTFAACRHVLAGADLGDETVAINRRAVELARQARDNVAPSRPVAIAGSMSTTRPSSITAAISLIRLATWSLWRTCCRTISNCPSGSNSSMASGSTWTGLPNHACPTPATLTDSTAASAPT